MNKTRSPLASVFSSKDGKRNEDVEELTAYAGLGLSPDFEDVEQAAIETRATERVRWEIWSFMFSVLSSISVNRDRA